MAAWAGRAEAKGHTEAARTLLAAGAYVNARTRKGMTPLHFAVQGGYAELVRLLVRKGANLDSETKAKKKPLDLLRDEQLRAVVRDAQLERDHRRAKSKEDKPKPKPQLEPQPQPEPQQASAPGEFHVPENPIAVRDEAGREGGGAAAATLEDGEKSTVEVAIEEEEEEEDANVVIGPKRKKTKIALTHLFSENDDDEVD
ncbi:hypothetical protein AXG93_167s1210 [Marchantia polymorpha subsp. ruderalis]|uniref:Uncharacterized protein n=1 Tax=Marchantia polymorpha subsp. ruderalis TaxID=1480154 RepID=A0A176WN88_MARPO|nr:hypothetical protein AXG93_167s1210 [Marchantia polymorpha subsp. ruderalis]